MRAIYEFGKLGRLRFISHLDLQRFMQRAIRRTDLPVAYSQGFNPHAQIAFASALAMGWSSEGELLDVKLSEPVAAEGALAALSAALPPDMPVYRIRLVEDRFPALMAHLIWSDYRIELSGEGAAQVVGAIDGYLAEERVMAMRKTKSGEHEADIRAMTAHLTAETNEANEAVLMARLMLTEKATLKPDLLVSALAARAGAKAPEMRIHRLRLLGESGGRAVPLFELPFDGNIG